MSERFFDGVVFHDGFAPTGVTLKAAPLHYRTVHRIADALAPEMRKAFLRAVEELRERIDLNRLQELLARGRENDLNAFWREFEASVAPTLRPAIREAFMETAQRSARTFGMAFDLTNPKAVEAIDLQAGQLIQNITAESRAAIREVLRRGFLQGNTVQEMARQIRGSIGLTERFARAVENYRQAQLDAGVLPGKVAERAERYARRLLNLRAETIARTETLAASNRGQQAVWEDARNQGQLPPDARRTWILTEDERTCEICLEIPDMNPDGVGINEPFKTPNGYTMTPPEHVMCRCAVGLSFAEEA